MLKIYHFEALNFALKFILWGFISCDLIDFVYKMYCFVYSILTHEMLKSSYVFGFKVLIFVQCTLAELDIILPLAVWSYPASIVQRPRVCALWHWFVFLLTAARLGQFLHDALYFAGFLRCAKRALKTFIFELFWKFISDFICEANPFIFWGNMLLYMINWSY